MVDVSPGVLNAGSQNGLAGAQAVAVVSKKTKISSKKRGTVPGIPGTKKPDDEEDEDGACVPA